MKILDMPRKTGKSTQCVYESATTGNMIVAHSKEHKEYLMNLAKKYNLDIPEPVAIDDIDHVKITNNVIVDDVDLLLSRILGCVVLLATQSSAAIEQVGVLHYLMKDK